MVPIVGGIPQPPITVLFEVKNIREWIYPNALELYQVLHKGVILQQANPTVPIVPSLICRGAQITAIYMAKALGFLIIDMGNNMSGTKWMSGSSTKSGPGCTSWTCGWVRRQACASATDC